MNFRSKIPDLAKFDVIDARLGRYADIRDLRHAPKGLMEYDNIA